MQLLYLPLLRISTGVAGVRTFLDLQTFRPFDLQAPSFHQLATCYSRNPFGFTTICVAGGVGRLSSSAVYQSPVTNHKSRLFKKLPPLAPLFAAFSPLVPFIFSTLQPLFAKQGGGALMLPCLVSSFWFLACPAYGCVGRGMASATSGIFCGKEVTPRGGWPRVMAQWSVGSICSGLHLIFLLRPDTPL